MGIFFFGLHESRNVYNKIIILLMCFFVILLYLYGEVYALGEANCPDKIMDLPYSIFLFRADYEQADCSELRDDKQLINDNEIQIFTIHNAFTIRFPFFLECVYPKNFKKRLTLLQRYNS